MIVDSNIATPPFRTTWFFGMPTWSQRNFLASFRLEPWLAALLALGLMVSGVDAGAASLSAAATSFADEHDQLCQCGPRCRGASCCCGPKKAKPRKSVDSSETKPASSTPAEETSGPCLGAMPCGDTAAPTGSATNLTGKSATLVLDLGKRTLESRRVRFHPITEQPPSRLSTRLERPPKSNASA